MSDKNIPLQTLLIAKSAPTVEEKVKSLIELVDRNFNQPKTMDILNAFTPLVIVIAVIFVVGYSLALSWVNASSIQITTSMVSLAAILISFFSFIMASRPYVRRRLAFREAKRLNKLTTITDSLCILVVLVAMKQEYYPMKLIDLYAVDPELFKPSKLLETFYLKSV